MQGIVARLRGVYRRVAVLPLLLLAARYYRYRSNFPAAKGMLQRAATIVPTCFSAHLRLGSLYLDERDFARAKREFLRAREINPGKFRRLYPLITGRSGDININLFYFPGFTDREPEKAPADFLREFIGEPLEHLREEFGPRGDFVSWREVRRFQEMGPIREDEVEAADWDEVARRLSEDPP